MLQKLYKNTNSKKQMQKLFLVNLTLIRFCSGTYLQFRNPTTIVVYSSLFFPLVSCIYPHGLFKSHDDITTQFQSHGHILCSLFSFRCQFNHVASVLRQHTYSANSVLVTHLQLREIIFVKP